MIINEEGNKEKQINSPYTELKCVFCNCDFLFGEKDIETHIEEIPYESGIKKFLGQIKDYTVHRYITCPWCKGKMKLKFTIDRIEEDKNATTRH